MSGDAKAVIRSFSIAVDILSVDVECHYEDAKADETPKNEGSVVLTQITGRSSCFLKGAELSSTRQLV